MTVTNPETFVFSFFGSGATGQGDSLVDKLAKEGITAVNSSGVVTITNSSINAVANGRMVFDKMLRAADATQAKFVYTAAT
jgi:hypothetical protein